MTNDDITDIAELRELLEEERRLVLSGELGELSEITSRRQELLDFGFGALSDPAEIEELRRLADRNSRLLEAALDGLRSVTDRLASLRRIRDGLDTYDSSGKRQTFAALAARTVERRA